MVSGGLVFIDAINRDSFWPFGILLAVLFVLLVIDYFGPYFLGFERLAKPRRELALRRGLAQAPGWRLHRAARWLFSGKTFITVIEPVLSDMQVEFFEALAAKQPIKARWVQFCGYWTFWQHVALQIPVSITRVLLTLWKMVG
jgi:hypothetical protein